jgi:hypothetical protein
MMKLLDESVDVAKRPASVRARWTTGSAKNAPTR